MSKNKEENDNFQEQYESLVGKIDTTDIRSQETWADHLQSLKDLSLAIMRKQNDDVKHEQDSMKKYNALREQIQTKVSQIMLSCERYDVIVRSKEDIIKLTTEGKSINELEISASKKSMFSLSVSRPEKTQKQTLNQISEHKKLKSDVKIYIENTEQLHKNGEIIGEGWDEVLKDYKKTVDTWKKKFYTPLDELLTLQDKLKYINYYTRYLNDELGLFESMSLKRPSLEKAHEFYSSICELEKSASSQLTRQQKKELREGKLAAESYCKKQLTNKDSGKNSELTELIELIDKKDPKLVARQMYEALKETSNGTQKNAQSADAIPEISSWMYETILQNCSPEQTMKLAKINQEVEILKGNKGKSSFIENIKLFCKKAASIALSKYKVKDVDLKKAFDQLEQVAYDPEKFKPIKTTSSYETKTKENLTSFVSKVNASRSKGQGQGQSNGIG